MSNPCVDSGPTRAYVLGGSAQELERQNTQARRIDPMMRHTLRAAGIVPGMRVLDVGSGAGHVAFLPADTVGETGEVVGVDRCPAALATARVSAEARPLQNVSFQEGDPTLTAFERLFDAVIGRYVLMFQPDPTAMVRKLADHIRPGGSIVFHEIDWDGVRSFPPLPTYDRCCRWIVRTLRVNGVETRMGNKLHSSFIAAGLPARRSGRSRSSAEGRTALLK